MYVQNESEVIHEAAPSLLMILILILCIQHCIIVQDSENLYNQYNNKHSIFFLQMCAKVLLPTPTDSFYCNY